MKINWFPGHMKKAMMMMDFEIKNVDLILYCLDSRVPLSCLNPNFNNLLNRKPIIFVLTKADLADENENKKWLQYFEKFGGVISLNSTVSGAGFELKKKINQTLQHKLDRNVRKGINIPLRAMVIGVPNTGKSTLINNLCGNARAIVGNKPGVTRGKQWVKIDENLELMDTPGTLWPDLENEKVARHLAFVGSIKEEVLDIPSLVVEFLMEMIQNYTKNLEERYGVEFSEANILSSYDTICLKRGWILKGKEPDYERGGRAILEDFRKGKLGRISLEKNNGENNYEKL